MTIVPRCSGKQERERNDIVSTVETFFAIVLLSVIMIFSRGVRRVIFLVILGILVMAKFAGF